jgi:chromosome segregation ATPase
MSNFRLDVYLHFADTNPITAILSRIEEKMSQLSDKIDELTTKVTAETTVEQAAITLLQGLSAQIADLKTQLQNAGVDPALLQKLTDLGSTIDARKQALADAIVANTPAG